MAGPAGAHGGGHPDHGIGGPSGISGHSAGTGAESASGGSALGPDAPAFGGSDPSGGSSGEAEYGGIAAFRSAIAKALGLQDLSGGVGTIGGPQAQPGSPALEAHDMDTDAVREAIDKAGMFDDPSNVDTSLDTPQSFREKEAKKMGIDFDSFTGRKSSIDNREPVDMYGRVAPIEDIEDPVERSLAYETLGKLQKAAKEARTPLGRALNTIMGYGINAVPGMGTLNMIGKAIKAGFAKAGFNVDPNIIGQAIRAAHEQTTQGPLGFGGTSVGSRNDSFIENFLANIPASSYDEPWMKDLNERQIQYYLDRPSELKWVRNLYNQMNPDSMMTL